MLHRTCRSGVVLVSVLSLLLIGVITGRGADLDVLIEAFFAASDAVERAEAIDAIVAEVVAPSEVAGRLRIGRSYTADVERDWAVHYSDCIDGVPRPFHVFVPEDYDPTIRYPVLMDLHGAVNNPPYSVEGLISRRALWGPTAAAEGWILVMPHGDEGATWWSEVGRANLLSQLAFVKRAYNVDEDRIFLSGFSDGGSGALWMAAHDATPWAGFVDIYGHPSVAGNGPYQTYPRNLINRPIRASNGNYDELYPAPEIELYVNQYLDMGIDIDWVAHPTGHSFDGVALERRPVAAFIERIARTPHPTHVVWETSDVVVGRCDWVSIDGIADVGSNAAFKDANIWPLKGEIRFGATFAYQGTEIGFIIAGVEPWTIAHFAGVKTGDKIVRIDAYPVETGYEVPAIIDAMNPGDSIEIEVIRDGETIVLGGQVTSIEAMYSRERITGSIEVMAEGNRIVVAVSNVSRYTLRLSSAQFDLSRPIVVVTNGVESFADLVEPDVRFMLEQAALDEDRRTVYEARLVITVAAGTP